MESVCGGVEGVIEISKNLDLMTMDLFLYQIKICTKSVNAENIVQNI